MKFAGGKANRTGVVPPNTTPGGIVIMIQAYYVNNNQTRNPGYHHEVHTETHMKQLGIRSAIYVGVFSNEIDAVRAAKRIYADADGCANCCPRAHKG